MAQSGNERVSMVNATVNETLEERRKNQETMTELSHCESERLKDISAHVVENSNRNLEALHNMNENIFSITESQVAKVDSLVNENLKRKQRLCWDITEHSEGLFSNIHDRMKEIEVFFAEGIQRDEKTGSELFRQLQLRSFMSCN